MNKTYCQSCGMPLDGTDELYATEADGSKNRDYCRYCYANGAFTADCTMDEMIEFCVPHMASAGDGMTPEEARAAMKAFFPTLKRWSAV